MAKFIKITKGKAWSTGKEGEVFKTYGTTESNGFEYYYVDPPGSSRRLVEKPNCVELTQVKRQAEVGEHVVIVKKEYEGDVYSEGDLFEAEGVNSRYVFSTYAVGDYNRDGVIRHSEYEVLVEDGGADTADEIPVPDGIVGVFPGESSITFTGELTPHSGIPVDYVNSPSHYNAGKFEVIEIIEQVTSGYEDPFVGYCVGNTQKYVARAPHKGKLVEDLKKSRKYLDFAIAHLEGKE
ncbi:DUF3310 domain-containing protein [Bacillus sp. 7894-2]|uniref:DUF3310 domain-containing protein n=1 Tax=Bacillus sp. 7894-2 TaxID=2021695 RepID=UPI000BA7530F|nr:DUF3310 domain-containing protein [Bacillus sp. 7894-2]PAE24047.1 hypothetical protein CHI10_14680 [Bacillus sp. 7894-2]